MLTGKRICGCGSAVWTKVIGWFEIIGSAFLLTQNPPSDALYLLSHASERSGPLQKYFTVLIVTVFIVSVLSFIMAIVLLHGSYTKNAHLMRIWIAWKVSLTTSMAMVGTVVIASSIIYGAILVIVLRILALVLACLFFNGVCMWTANLHKKNIQASSGQMAGYRRAVYQLLDEHDFTSEIL